MQHRRLVLAVLVLLLATACGSTTPAQQQPRGRVWFCQGVDAQHAAGGLVDVTISWPDGASMSAKVQVPGVAEFTVVPGTFLVTVDGKSAFNGQVVEGGTSSSRVGSGCPAAP